MRRALAIVVLALLAWPGEGMAEIVQLQVGPGVVGNGWLFLDRDGRCKVLTAGHVVMHGGQRAEVQVLRRGQSLGTDVPEILSIEPAPDIALLPVQVGRDPAECSRSRLSRIGIVRRLLAMRDGFIETNSPTGGESMLVPVQRAATQNDAWGGELFSVTPRDPSVRLAKGWSGSVVRDGEGVLGIVSQVELDGSAAIIVRIDVLDRLTRLAAPPSRRAGFDRVLVVLGETVDTANGPLGLVDRERPPWRVRPANRRVVFRLSADRPSRVRRVSVEMAPRSAALLRMDIAVGLHGPEGLRFEGIRSCGATSPSPRLSCGFLEQDRRDVEISLLLDAAGPVEIRSASVE